MCIWVALGGGRCFEHMPGTYNSAEQKSFVSSSPGEIKRRRDKKTFPLLQATDTWQPPRNLKYHSAAAYILDLCEWYTLYSQMLSSTHTHWHTVCQTFRNILMGGRETPTRPWAVSGGAFCFGRCFCECLLNDNSFSLSPLLLLWLLAICIGSVIPPGNMGQV